VEKNLYSTDNGSTFKQSVDYRYNIRGWMSSINNSSLANDNGTTNDDNNDLFGMNVLYEQQDAGLINTPQFNGGISAIKWSTNLGLSNIKERAYNLSFDPMNRLTAATHFEKTGSWAQSSSYHENNISYDQNGNLLSLSRKGSNGSVMDVLTYNYTNNGNQLRSVTDGGDILKGFVDGNIGSDDYTYDANGSMTVDKNKNITAITYNYLRKPQQVTFGTGSYMQYVYDAKGTKLSESVYNSSNVLQKKIDYVGEFHYQNDTLKFINHDEGRIVMTGTTPEYIYDIQDPFKDANLSFTTKQSQDVSTATFETANLATEQSKFLRYDEVRMINCTLFDHTHNGVTSYSERLNGTANEVYGLAKSFSVMAGDTIKMEVYDKYVDPTSSDWTAALATLLGQIASGTAAAGTVIDGANYSTNGITPFPYVGLAGTGSSTGTGPKAYMNWLIFDRNYVFVNGGYVQMTNAAKEDGTNVPFEKLTASFVINQPGYVYVYLSNENPTPIEVHFDDWKVTQVKSPIVQSDDFYPFGLRFDSYNRESSIPNKFLFHNKTEFIDDLGLNTYHFRYRMYDPALGRFWSVDPLAEKYYYNSPYAFAENKLGMGIELEGLELMDFGMLSKAVEFKIRTATSVSNIQSAAGNLASGNSGNVPKDVTMSGEDRNMVKVGSQISDAKTVTDGVKDIAKTGVRMGAEGAQEVGQGIEVAGIATGQPEIAGAGELISDVGKGVEMAMDASDGKLKAGDVGYEVGKQVVFKGMGKSAEKAAEAGNLDKVANNIFQGFVKGWEMLSDWVKDKVDDKK
jgi:RHS repeat-associated protein